MFDSLADRIREDERQQFNRAARIVESVVVAAVSVVVFVGIYWGIHLLH